MLTSTSTSADAETDPMAGFLYALQSPISKKKNPQRFRVFLTFLGYDGSGMIKDNALQFLKKARQALLNGLKTSSYNS